MPWSYVDTEYSIKGVQHTLSTAYTENCIHWVLQTPSTQSPHYRLSPALCQSLISHLSYLCGHCFTQFSIFLYFWVNQWIKSQLPSHILPDQLPPDWLPPDWPPPDWPPPDWPPPDRLPPEWLPPDLPPSHRPPPSRPLPDWPPPSAPSISIDYGLQVHLPTCMIILWWNGRALIAPEGNSWERAVLALRAEEQGRKIWQGTCPCGTAQFSWIFEGSALVSEEPHRLSGSMNDGQECLGPRAGKDRLHF